MTPAEKKCRLMKHLHGQRRLRDECINNAKHGEAYGGGRCKRCWKAKLKAERLAYAARKTSKA